MSEHHIPGAMLAILRDGKMIYSKGYGVANLEHSVPITPKTVFLMASLTKMFTATAIMMLEEDGKVVLSDRIDKYVSDLPEAWRSITVLQLLHHTSGIKYPMEMPFPCKFEYDVLNYTQANVIAETGCLPLEFEPGSRYRYSGRGYYVLGMLIERVSGKSFGDFLTERIFKPLGMNDTGMIDLKRIVPNRAAGYKWTGKSYVHSNQMDPTVELSDGGLMTTVLDLAKWDASLYTEKLLKRRTLERMWTNGRLNDGTPINQYGMGFELSPYKGKKRIGHTGLIPGFAAGFQRFPEGNITTILLTNAEQEDYDLVPTLAKEIALIYVSR